MWMADYPYFQIILYYNLISVSGRAVPLCVDHCFLSRWSGLCGPLSLTALVCAVRTTDCLWSLWSVLCGPMSLTALVCAVRTTVSDALVHAVLTTVSDRTGPYNADHCFLRRRSVLCGPLSLTALVLAVMFFLCFQMPFILRRLACEVWYYRTCIKVL